ncbi:MAG: acyl-CoA dehydrogenase C-terminal domain-containing protein [Proteobacteria bacterium]|jgi:alkylation response protein AidB-like acyl-CoA dehydrogenase|nr:acyl-CoA dehydrogenase C-terminal domain-containing protein [Pseudomonadales bacterium]MDA0805630.1 acyl-CoA dehydrogenase C-terminal domain-containing protein [Pseudomonadota bacterium]MDA0896731.1 acyl-CoA dehydrogenase C-terminal domain-containing protein [Pseudomonadota bacterium]MDA1244260.1 acyl-CoA dehydrogenase C-terminal domain-containing protein [Pseudomonadota bacterium]
MPAYRAPIQDIGFLLNNVFTADTLFSSMPGTEEVSTDLTSAIVEEAGKIAEGLLAPINQSGDQQSCQYNDGVVTTPDGFKEAYKAYAEGGWAGLTGEVAYGGQGMPKTLSALIEEMSFAANSSFALFTILTTGATLTLSQHGSEELKQRYLPKMYEGVWTGTMCLTEPHAGTDLGMIKTRAVPNADGSYSLSGTKIFITAGEHDLAENIIHLVLAKLPDAPAGPRGISLFLVPKMLVDEQSELTGERNGVRCGSIEHKMGIKASPTCVMNFDEAKGYLVGELNNGLSHMFTMMNYERLSMGLQANGLADSAYQVAAAYAKERVQGRAPTGPQQPEASADPLLVHPDVRRLLLTIRANVLAGRSLSIFAAMQLDISRFHPEADARARADKLVSLLIPVQKAYCTDRGFDACVMAQQVLGGHGYVAEWGLEQNVRDARIAQIYEGANGVQALDLMGRKTVRANGELLALLSEEMDAFVAAQADVAAMQPYLSSLATCRSVLAEATRFVIEGASKNPEEIGAASYAYMELMGLTLYCFMWQRILAAALADKNGNNAEYLDGLVKVGEFFLARQVPRVHSLLAEIEAGSDSLMAMAANQF